MTDTEATHTARNPWKLIAIGMAIAGATALATGMVVASRTRGLDGSSAVDEPAAPRSQPDAVRRTPASPAVTPARKPAQTVAQATGARVPDHAAIAACNDHAEVATGQRNKTVEVVKDATVGALVGAAVGAAGGAIADGGKGAGKGAAIGGLVGAGAGTLYGVNDNRKHDAAYRDAYASCMRSRGYAG